LAVERAREFGIATVGVKNSNHFGAAGAYSRNIAKAGFIGLATTSAAARVACFGGREPMFGTNPISIAFGSDFCLDMATSQVCYSEIKERARTRTPLESGWAIDDAGQAISDAGAMHALSPLGGYKGQGLAMSVTLLTSILMGGPLDWEMEHLNSSTDGQSRGVCHFFLAINPDVFGGRVSVAAACESLITSVRNSEPSDPGRSVLIPGDVQRSHKARQLLNGLELDSVTYSILKEWV
jgi:LDH2 family malate/lactate/ureidoglycolate dehydrogenase